VSHAVNEQGQGTVNGVSDLPRRLLLVAGFSMIARAGCKPAPVTEN
jgi:hypothetical protein